MKAKKSLAKGCDSFLAYVIDAKKEKKTVADIPVVRDFPEVFPDELPGFPPVREVEYRIDLMPGSTPVAKAPYRLAPSEIRDMMTQIQDLLDRYYRRFIKDFSKIAGPLTKLTRKDVSFQWGDEQEKAFQTLKQLLCQAPIFSLPEGTDDFMANVVADALSRKGSIDNVKFMRIEIVSDLIERLKMTQLEALRDEHLKSELLVKRKKDLIDDSRGLKIFNNRIWVPLLGELRELIMNEAHKSRLSIHPGKIPEWKWEHITMDFVTKLSRTQKGHDMIWVIVDRLTKSAHFLPASEMTSLSKLAQLYINEVVVRHGIPLSIMSDRDLRFVLPWKGVIRFGKRGKLSPRYIGPFNIRQILNDQTVVLDLLAELAGIHNTFNISYLRKCKVDDESQILPLQDLKVDMNKKLVEEPVRVVDRKVTRLRKK
ncbi:uncharacterized protein [Rutidosis leptorrhynchoides]|uniref:uncharacterized protein n=1 Tax=Rutidosis leptorrhynchoides TaxID=125765 RepID=UPI003A999AEB